MPRVQCPDCERILKVADDTKATAVRCPCGCKVTLDKSEEEERIVAEPARPTPRRRAEVEDEDEDDRDAEPERKRRSGGKSRVALWGVPRGKTVDVESGRVVPRSLLKTFFKMGAGWILFLIGLMLLCGGVCAIFASFGVLRSNDSPWVTALCGIGGLLAGLGSMVVGAICTYADLARVWHKERLIVGETSLQRLLGAAEALLHLPFDNIDTIRLESKTVGTGRNRYTYYFIGINVREIKRPDTIVNREELRYSRDQHDFDVTILDEFRGSLESLYGELTELWKEALKESGDEEARRRIREHDRYEKDRRWRAGWRKGIALVVSICLGGLFVLCCGGMGVAAVAQWLGLIKNAPPPPPVAGSNPGTPNPNPGGPKGGGDGSGGEQPKEQPPPRVTGDTAIDKALADLGDKQKQSAGLTSLAKMQPNEQHRTVVAAKVAALADTSDVYTRQCAIQALDVWASPKEVPILNNALNDPAIYTRQVALKALTRFKDPSSVAPMIRCLREFQTQAVAEDALRQMGSVAEKELLPLLQDEGAPRIPVIRILKDIGTKESLPALEALLTDQKAFSLQGTARDAIMAIKERASKGP
jgi:hypothetical protein